MSIVKTVIRVAVVGGLATGAAVLVAGPERVFALAGQARQAVITTIDQNIKDPVALRSQLRTLEAEYPKRIAAVRGDLAEVQSQMAELERDRSVSQKVVEMAAADLTQLKEMLGRAESARNEQPSAVISVRFDERAYSLDQAYTRATQVTNTLNVYQARVQGAERDMGFLTQQKDRLAELLNTLETERAQFQAQIFQLDGQIEMIARNDKLIDMVERRQDSIEQYGKFESVSLDQITSRMEKIRAEQEARLQSFSNQTKTTDYEKKARIQLENENAAKNIFDKTQQLMGPTVAPAAPAAAVEIAPTPTIPTTTKDRVASATPTKVIID
jgi:chromosome segregation ATPase